MLLVAPQVVQPSGNLKPSLRYGMAFFLKSSTAFTSMQKRLKMTQDRIKS